MFKVSSLKLYVLNIDNSSGGLSALDGMVGDFYPGRLPRAVLLLPFRQWVCQLRTGGGLVQVVIISC
jgi:hypothetical protein